MGDGGGYKDARCKGNSETRDPDVRDPLCPLPFGSGQEWLLFLAVLYLRQSFPPPLFHVRMVNLNTQVTPGVGEKAINGSRLILRRSVLFAEKGHSNLTVGPGRAPHICQPRK